MIINYNYIELSNISIYRSIIIIIINDNENEY